MFSIFQLLLLVYLSLLLYCINLGCSDRGTFSSRSNACLSISILSQIRSEKWTQHNFRWHCCKRRLEPHLRGGGKSSDMDAPLQSACRTSANFHAYFARKYRSGERGWYNSFASLLQPSCEISLQSLVPGRLNQTPGPYAIWIWVTLLLSLVGARAANPSNISSRGSIGLMQRKVTTWGFTTFPGDHNS